MKEERWLFQRMNHDKPLGGDRFLTFVTSEYLRNVAVWRHCYVNGASVRERRPNYFNSYIRPMGFDSWCWQRMLWNSMLRLDGNWVSQRTHYVWCPAKLQRQTWSRVCLGNFTCAGTWTREGSRWSSAKQQWWKQLALADKWILMNSMQPPQQKRHTTLLFFDIQGIHERIQLNPRHSLHICGGSWGCASTKPIMFTVFFWFAEVVLLKEYWKNPYTKIYQRWSYYEWCKNYI